LHISTRLRIANFFVCNGWIDRFKRRHNIVYRTLLGENRTVYPETVEGWENYPLLQETEDCDLCDILYNADETGLYFNLQPAKTFAFQGHFCRGGIKSEMWVTVLLACNADGSDKLPSLVTEKYCSV
jgi:hypothetical protein